MEKPWLRFYDPYVPKAIAYPEIILPQILDDTADRFPEKRAVFFFGGVVRYGELRAQANQFAHALRKMGLEAGSGLGLLLPNMPQAVISTYGALKAGVRVFFFDPLAENEEIQRQINVAGVETLVVLDILLPRIDRIFPQTGVKKFIISAVKEFLPFPKSFFFSLAARGKGIHVKLAKKPHVSLFKEFIKGEPWDRPPHLEKPVSPEDVAVIEYTHGTTGPPKGVMLSHKNLVVNLLQISSWFANLRRGEEIFFAAVPFHEAYGLTMGMNLPIYWAAGSIHQPRFDPLQFLPAVKTHRPTFFPARPSMIEALAWNPQLAKYGISSIRNYFSLGPCLPEDALQGFEGKAGNRVIEGYGLTEASPLTHANPVNVRRKVGSIGIPLPDTEAEIVDPESGRGRLPAGAEGELIIKGAQVMKGYWNQPEETARALREGWLHTGDLARMDEDGFFYILGRVKRK